MQLIQYQLAKEAEEMTEAMKTLHATDGYSLKASMFKGRLSLELTIFDQGFISKSFSGDFGFDELSANVRDNFSNMSNVYSYLCDPNNCGINFETGVINMCSTLRLQNGTVIKIPTGEINLSPYERERNEQLYHLIPIIYSEHELPNHEIKSALQLICQCLTGMTQKLFELEKNKSTVKKQPNSPKSPSNRPRRSSATLKIPKLFNDLDKSYKETDVTELARSGICNSNTKNSDELGPIRQDVSECSHKDLSTKLMKTEKKLQMLKIQVQQNKNFLLRKLARLEKSTSEVQSKLVKTIKKIGEQSVFDSDEEDVSKSSRSKGASASNNSSFLEKMDFCSMDVSRVDKKSEGRISKTTKTTKTTTGQFKDNIKIMESPSIMDSNKFDGFKSTESQNEEKEEDASYDCTEIDTSCSFINRFNIVNNIATYKGEDWTKTQLLGKVSTMETHQYSILIVKTKRRYLWIGVADSSYSSKRWSWGSPNWVYYCGWNGKVYEGPDQNVKAMGGGFKQGQTLNIKVDHELGSISWSVNDGLRAVHFSDKLKDKSIRWVPLVKFFDQGDSVEWLRKP